MSNIAFPKPLIDTAPASHACLRASSLRALRGYPVSGVAGLPRNARNDARGFGLFSVVGLFLLSSCAIGPSAKQAELDKMSLSCGLPKGTALDRTDSVELVMGAAPDAQKMECLLGKLRAAGINNLGFTGNELPRVVQ
jgi:hypothetical protein